MTVRAADDSWQTIDMGTGRIHFTYRDVYQVHPVDQILAENHRYARELPLLSGTPKSKLRADNSNRIGDVPSGRKLAFPRAFLPLGRRPLQSLFFFYEGVYFRDVHSGVLVAG
jgi:hypothetical protein